MGGVRGLPLGLLAFVGNVGIVQIIRVRRGRGFRGKVTFTRGTRTLDRFLERFLRRLTGLGNFYTLRGRLRFALGLLAAKVFRLPLSTSRRGRGGRKGVIARLAHKIERTGRSLERSHRIGGSVRLPGLIEIM